MSNTVEIILVGNPRAQLLSLIDGLGLPLQLYCNHTLHGGNQLILATQIRAASICAHSNREAIPKLVNLVTSAEESDIENSTLSLTIEDDNEEFTGTFSSISSGDDS